MKIKYIIYILWSLLVISSCSEDGFSDEFPPDISTEPVFEIQASLGPTNPVGIQAGVNNFYMYTDFNEDSTNYTLIGRLAAEDGTSVAGDEELKFSIDFPLNIPLTTETLNSSIFDYTEQIITSSFYQYNFNSILSSAGFGSPVNYVWTFENSQISTEENPSYERVETSPFKVSLTTEDAINCSSTYTGWVSTDINSDSTFLLDLTYETNPNNNSIEFIVHNPDVTVDWSNGFVGDTLIFDTSVMLADTFPLTAQAFNQYGKRATAMVEILNIASQAPAVCITKFDYQVVAVDIINTNVVVIEYQKDGRKYSSAIGDQPSDRFFYITEVEDFQINENGLSTFKLKVNFKVRLYDVDNGDFRLFTGGGYIGVAYPG